MMYEELETCYNNMFSKGKINVLSYVETPVCMAMTVSTDEYEDVLTVNLGEMSGNGTIMPMYCAFLDTNNCPGIDEYLFENGYAEPYKRFGEKVYMQSGFCEYPLYQFNAEKLKSLDPEGCKTYEDGYKPAFSKIQRRLNAAMFGFEIDPESIEDDAQKGLGE